MLVGGLSNFVVKKGATGGIASRVGLKESCLGNLLIIRLPIGSWEGIYF